MMERWSLLMQAFDDIEAGIARGLLEGSSIPVRLQEADPMAGSMRLISGRAQGIDIFVPERMLIRARAILAAAIDPEEGGEPE